MIKYYLNGTECNPLNKDSVQYKFDFTDRKIRELELSIDSLEFVGDDKTTIETWRNTYGDFVGIPLDIVYSSGLTVKYILTIDTTETNTIKCKCKRYRGIDNFFDNANGMTFSAVNWSESDFRYIDYVIIPENQSMYYISLALAVFSLSQELAKSVQEIAEAIADIVKASTPVGLPIPAPDFGAIAVAIIKLLARITYAIFIVIALIRVATELINIIFPQIRQFKCISYKTLIEKGCQRLGYQLSSTLLNSLSGLTIIPVPLRPKQPQVFRELFAPQSLAFTNGFPSTRDVVSTLGRAIEEIENIFNAKTKVSNGVVTIEQELFFEQNPQGLIPLSFNLQDKIESKSTTNKTDIFKRLVASYQIDPIDLNTFDDQQKTLYEVSSETIVNPDINLVEIKGFDNIGISFARATNKGTLTFVEQSAKAFATAIDLFCGSDLSSQVEARKNCMQISSQYFGVTKLAYLNGTKLHSNQNQFIGCDVIVENYHYSRFIQNGQKDLIEALPVAMTESEMFDILDNNFVTLTDGRVIDIQRLNWSEIDNVAIIDVAIRKQSTNEKTIIINAG